MVDSCPAISQDTCLPGFRVWYRISCVAIAFPVPGLTLRLELRNIILFLNSAVCTPTFCASDAMWLLLCESFQTIRDFSYKAQSCEVALSVCGLGMKRRKGGRGGRILSPLLSAVDWFCPHGFPGPWPYACGLEPIPDRRVGSSQHDQELLPTSSSFHPLNRLTNPCLWMFAWETPYVWTKFIKQYV